MIHFPPSLERLVLCCIDADFCNQILILQHFSRSNRFIYFCTAHNSKFQQKTRHKFGKNESKWIIIHSNILKFCIKIAISLRILDEKNPEFHRCVQKYPISLKNLETLQKIAKFRCKSPKWMRLFIDSSFGSFDLTRGAKRCRRRSARSSPGRVAARTSAGQAPQSSARTLST